MTKAYLDPANYSTGQHHRRSNPVSYDVRFQDIGRINLMTEIGALMPGSYPTWHRTGGIVATRIDI